MSNHNSIPDHEQPYSGVTLVRREQSYRERSRAWYHPSSGAMILPDGHAEDYDPRMGYGLLLEQWAAMPVRSRPDMVMLCGGATGADTPTRDELEAPAAFGWSVSMRYDDTRQEYNRAHVTYRRDGITIELRTTAEWFGSATDPRALREAWYTLQAQLRRVFNDPRICLISTPGRTGMDLLERSLPRHKSGPRAGWSHEYPVLAEPLRELLYANNGQGRLEIFPQAPGNLLPGLYCLDARWMYAACLSNLPSGPLLHDTADNYMPHAPGFYRVAGRVPRGWDAIGLLPQLRYRGDERERTYPRRPGERFEGWVTAAELELALEHNWPISIAERIIWPVTAGDPARTWITKLRGQRAIAEAQAAEGDRTAGLIARALRAIVLQTVGMWHRRSGYEVRSVPHAEVVTLPAGAELLADRGGRITYRVATPLADLRYSHPEWSATVWGRARARLARQALLYGLADLVALRTDALWLAAEDDPSADGWPRDTGQPGSWRYKGIFLPGPLPAPQSEADLLELIRQARAEEEAA